MQAFAGSKNLKRVIIGDQVASIGIGAFRNCKNLKSVVIGKGVKGIPARAFGGCKALKRITIKSGKLKKAGRNAFKGSHQSPEGEAESIQKAAEKQRTGEESTDRYITEGKQEKLIISIVEVMSFSFVLIMGK